MKNYIAMLLAVSVVHALPAHAATKDCEELKSEIAAKIDAKGVKSYSLEIVAAGAVIDGKVVGSCSNGTQRITYKKN